jgi:hypothetical protein
MFKNVFRRLGVCQALFLKVPVWQKKIIDHNFENVHSQEICQQINIGSGLC